MKNLLRCCVLRCCEFAISEQLQKSKYNINIIFCSRIRPKTQHETTQQRNIRKFYNYLIMSKIVKKRKGTVSTYDDDSFEFSPYGKGEPVYDHSYKVGGSTLGLTKGTRDTNFIAHLKCNADEPDPLGVLQEQLTKLAAKEWPEKKVQPFAPRNKVLLQSNGMYVALDERKKKVSLHLDIDVSEKCDCSQTISAFVIAVNQCLYINQDLLRRVCRATKKPSMQ